MMQEEGIMDKNATSTWLAVVVARRRELVLSRVNVTRESPEVQALP
jgi:hypothetical protein